MALVKSRNNRIGVTYVYESESYWDKEKQQPRSRRKLIGKIDEETGEIVPTGKRGPKAKETTESGGQVTLNGEKANKSQTNYEEILKDRDLEISQLHNELHRLQKENAAMKKDILGLADRYRDTED